MLHTMRTRTITSLVVVAAGLLVVAPATGAGAAKRGSTGCGQQAGRLRQGPGRELRGRGRARGTGDSDAANGGKARRGGA